MRHTFCKPFYPFDNNNYVSGRGARGMIYRHRRRVWRKIIVFIMSIRSRLAGVLKFRRVLLRWFFWNPFAAKHEHIYCDYIYTYIYTYENTYGQKNSRDCVWQFANVCGRHYRNIGIGTREKSEFFFSPLLFPVLISVLFSRRRSRRNVYTRANRAVEMTPELIAFHRYMVPQGVVCISRGRAVDRECAAVKGLEGR